MMKKIKKLGVTLKKKFYQLDFTNNNFIKIINIIINNSSENSVSRKWLISRFTIDY